MVASDSLHPRGDHCRPLIAYAKKVTQNGVKPSRKDQPCNQSIDFEPLNISPTPMRARGLETEFNYVANATISQRFGNVTPNKNSGHRSSVEIPG